MPNNKKNPLLYRKYTIQLRNDVTEGLEKFATIQGVKTEEIIQDALDEYMDSNVEATNDPLFDVIVEFIITQESISIVLLHRKYAIGYGRAQRIVALLGKLGYIEQTQESEKRVIRKRAIS